MDPPRPDDAPSEELAPYRIEAARSSRSRCKACRRPIKQGALRLGILVEGRFGPGYMWHHLNCAAKRRAEAVEEAYADACWDSDLEVPPLDTLRALAERAEQEKAAKKTAPYAEVAPTGRSKCRHCDELIDKGTLRIGLLREVEFYGQTRSGVINVHPQCVRAELEAENCLTEADGFEDALRVNSFGLDPELIERALREIGDLP